MARVWYVGTYPYREITPKDWDDLGVFGPHFQWSSNNGWSIDQDEFRPEHLAYLAEDPEFLLGQEGVRPDTPMPPDDVTRPHKADASILKLVDDAFEALDLANAALANIDLSETAAAESALEAGGYRDEFLIYRNEAEDAADRAAISETNAGESEDAASLSETNARNSEIAADQSEDQALIYRNEAEGFKNTASQKATLAGTKATEAQGFRNEAEGFKNTAGTSAGTASTKASEAQGFRNQAEIFRDEALSARLSWKGAWSSGTAYLERDVVSYGGSSWWAKQPSTGVEPTEGATWALVASRGEKGEGITSAEDLTGALTDQVDVSSAMVDLTLETPDQVYHEVMPLSDFLGAMYGTFASTNYSIDYLAGLIDSKADEGHTHPVTDLTATGTRSSSTYLRGDGSWATPTNTTYSIPTQAEAEAGTATTGRAFSAQRVRQAADAAITAREWVGTQAQYNAIGTKNPNITYYIVD